MQDLTPGAIGSPHMPDHEAAIRPAQSPLWPQHLVDLFIRPRQFFAGQLALGKTPYVLFVTWCFGIATAIDRIDQEILRADMGAARAGWDSMAPVLVGSWAGYWATILAYGAVSGLMIWYLGGWWYAKRLSWSGAKDPDHRLARLSGGISGRRTLLHAAARVSVLVGGLQLHRRPHAFRCQAGAGPGLVRDPAESPLRLCIRAHRRDLRPDGIGLGGQRIIRHRFSKT
jgi:hypothetical protein